MQLTQENHSTNAMDKADDSILVGSPPQTPLGELTALPQTP